MPAFYLRYWRIGVSALFVAASGLWLPSCSPGGSSPPANTNGNDGAGDGGNDGAAEAITEANAQEFADAFDGTLAKAMDAILSDPSLLNAKQRQAKRGPNLAAIERGAESISNVAIGGVRGSVRADGTRFATFWPPRFEITMTLEGYETDEGIALDGTVEYNFVRDDRADPPQEFGLRSGTVTVSGRFSGEVTVQSSIVGSQRSTSITSATGVVLLVGAFERPGFLTYVSTIAGTGETGLQNGTAAQATFNYPTGIALDDDGRVYVADQRNGAIREIDLDGTVSTVSSDFQEPYDIGFDSKGKLVVSDQLGGSHDSDESPLLRLVVRGDDRGTITPMILGGENPFSSFPLCPTYSCDGRPPLSAMPWPGGIDVQNQSVLVAQWALGAGLKLVLPDGYLMTLLSNDYPVTTICDETYPGSPSDLVQGNNGEIYYTTGCHAVRVFEPDGTVRTLAGRLQNTLEFADGVGDAARFSYPEGLVFDGERYLFVADSSNGLIRRVDVETGAVIRVAGCVAHTPGLECDDDLTVRDGPGDHAYFDGPQNIAIDKWGDLYVAEAQANVIRLVRIIADPNRTPSVHRFDPAVMQQGDTGTFTLSGRNLTTVQSIDLGAGVTATLERTGYQKVTANVTVAADAEPGPRRLTITTSFGAFTTAEDLSFTVLADTRGGIQVETIAGTGSAEPDRLNYGPAKNTTFAFPGGMHAISSDRLLVADPVEQRIRLIATRVGAVEEFFELLTYAASGTGVDVLGGIIGVFDTIESTLDFLGLGSGIVGQTEDAIRGVAEQSVDEICNTIGVDDCTWLSLPWAGLPYVPGENNGFRLEATFFLPTDIWADPAPFGVNSRFYIADSGNSTVRVVGYDVEQDQPAPMQVFSTDDQPDHPFAVTPENTSVYASLPSSLMLSQLSTNSGAVNGDYASIPRGVPLGIANYDGDSGTDERSIFVADPLNATIWRVVNNGGVSQVKNIRGDVPSFVIGDCVDGPATFATWGAPMDVAVDQTGTVYVADAGCNSIRVIKDAGFGQDLDGLVGSLREFVASNQSRISAEAAQRIEENLRLFDTEFLDANRFMVTTLAGSPDGQAGFEDGPAALARFNSPTAVAVASTGDGTVIFVADTGNRRIRRIVVP
jgi:sugar lactone lactonase YvrE